jgi:outer membrane murein-binding lipoprotein Lpp
LLFLANIVSQGTDKGNREKACFFIGEEVYYFHRRCSVTMTTEDLQAIRAVVRDEIKKETAPIIARLDTMQADIDQIKEDVVQVKEDIEQVKEDAAVTREAVNAIGEWTDAASDVLKIRYPIER